jgi:hypothetical protein
VREIALGPIDRTAVPEGEEIAESLDDLDNTRTKLRAFSIPVMISSP